MDTRLVLASGNAKKLVELRSLCQDLQRQGLGVEALGPGDWQAEGHPPLPDVAETGDTFLENALLKAASAARATGLSALADDSGLCVVALDGQPGVRSARWAGEPSDDARNRAKLLEDLRDVADRRAWFQCTLVLCGPLAEGPDCGRLEDGLAWRAFTGRVDGLLLAEERGSGGFGYDPLFLQPELGKTFAEAEAAEKHAISHRGQAMAALALYLQARPHATAERKPLFLRIIGLEALTRAMERALRKNLRYADQALEGALGEAEQLGPKERMAVAELHWNALRRLSLLHTALLALRGTPPPRQPPDPLRLEPRDAPLLACLALAAVDLAGRPYDLTSKAPPPSSLDGLLERNASLRDTLPAPRQALQTALRTAAYHARRLEGTDGKALDLGYAPTFLQALRDDLGQAHADAAAAYMNHRGPLTIRVNRLKAEPDEVARELQAAGVPTAKVPGLPDARVCLEPARLTTLAAFREGRLEIQDEGSQRIVAMVGVQPGQTVLDWCAGAGGKTLGLAAAMRDRGRLVALDNHPKRLEECARRLQRAGVTCATTRILPPGRAPLPDLLGADAVLVDAPCTSTGALRRSPELRWHLDEAWLTRFSAQQLGILERAARHLRAGGRLVYATCSLLRRENEAVIQQFLALHADFQVVAEQRFGPADAAWLATNPLAQFGPDGFYCCALQRAQGSRT